MLYENYGQKGDCVGAFHAPEKNHGQKGDGVRGFHPTRERESGIEGFVLESSTVSGQI
jgi:hypothetical protein